MRERILSECGGWNRPHKEKSMSQKKEVKMMVTVIILVVMTAAVAFAEGVKDGQGPGKMVVIPDGVTSIEDGEFTGQVIVNVTIPGSVVSIGYAAFANNKLTSVVIPDSVTYIGDMAFSGNSLTSVTLPAGVELGDEALPCQAVYEENDKQAGTYVASGGTWIKQ
jgi:hypothetical protein